MNGQTPFGALDGSRIVGEDTMFVVTWDKYPVSPGHCLIIAKRQAERFSELSADEEFGVMHWIDLSMRHLQQSLRPEPDGFNVGFNDAAAAGQTVKQFHVHVIPRYKGDVPDPRGGIRWVIPETAKYWT
jgi:diadenosine tetraphosphate (Ap4A) HIT family hydrolase